MLNQTLAKNVSNYYEPVSSRTSRFSSVRDTTHDGKGSFKSANLQEIFLNNCRKNENPVRIELLKGDAKEGKIIGFDTQSVILSNEQTQFIIYKSAITAVIPMESVQYIFNEIIKKDYCRSQEEDILHIRAEKACHHA